MVRVIGAPRQPLPPAPLLRSREGSTGTYALEGSVPNSALGGRGQELETIARSNVDNRGGAAGHLDDGGGVGEVEPPGPHRGADFDDLVVLVKVDEVDGKAHELGMDPLGGPEKH